MTLTARALQLIPKYIEFALKRIARQAGHEAWSMFVGGPVQYTAPTATVTGDPVSIEQSELTLVSFPPENPPELPQLALFAFIARLIKQALPVGNGGVGE